MNDKQKVKFTNSKVTLNDFRKLHNTGENFITNLVYTSSYSNRKHRKQKSFLTGLQVKFFPNLEKLVVIRWIMKTIHTKELIGRKSKSLEDFQSFEIISFF
jgi:hypothetical protein